MKLEIYAQILKLLLLNKRLNLLQSYGGFQWREDVQECLAELENLNPEEDIEYFCNCLDTHIRFINHEETYRRLFKIELEEIEHDMGFEFY